MNFLRFFFLLILIILAKISDNFLYLPVYRDDIEVVVANPKTAGVARWIFLALWGHKMSRGETEAKKFVTKVFDNVEVMPRDAREASDVFYTQGFGDALLTYENEAVFTNLVVSPKAPLPYISPNNNVRITCPGALVDRNIETQPPEVREAAEAFINYLFTPTAQKEFVACGFRTTNKIAAAEGEAPFVKNVWEVEKKLGNWVSVQKKFFDEGGILSEIMNDVSKRKLEQRLRDRAAKDDAKKWRW
jgi:sulfate/thiosulfate transport system substrate-binding protein